MLLYFLYRYLWAKLVKFFRLTGAHFLVLHTVTALEVISAYFTVSLEQNRSHFNLCFCCMIIIPRNSRIPQNGPTIAGHFSDKWLVKEWTMKKLLLLCVIIIILVKFSKSQDYLNHTFFKYHQTPNVLKYYAENLNSESSSVIERSNPYLWQGSNLVLPEKFKNEQFLPGILFNNTRPIPLLYWLLPKETLGKSSLKKLYRTIPIFS